MFLILNVAEGPVETCKRVEKMIVYNTDIKPTWLNIKKIILIWWWWWWLCWWLWWWYGGSGGDMVVIFWWWLRWRY